MRWRLVVVAVATTTMVAVAFVIPLGLLVREFARDRALSAAETDARSLAPALVLTEDLDTLESAVGATGAGADGRMSLLLPDGTWVGGRLAHDRSVAAARRGTAGTVTTPTGARVLVPVVLGRRGTAVVAVDVPRAILERGVKRSWGVLAVLAVGLVGVAVTVADRLARGLVRPVERLARAATAIGAGDLTARTPESGPREVADVASAFNAMADRIGHLLAAEREMVADLSHRLRTPLTRLRLDAEALPPPAGADLVADVDALEAEVNALIAEARAPAGVPGSCDAAAVVADRVEFWSPLAAEEGREWHVTSDPGTLTVRVAASELAAAVDALVGNVFAHTPETTPFAVAVTRRGAVVGVVVDDAGAGFAPASAERGVSGSGSTGLGLDIARRTAESAGGAMEIDRSPLGGARVELLLPAAGVSDAG